jgi:hypothetical protein
VQQQGVVAAGNQGAGEGHADTAAIRPDIDRVRVAGVAHRRSPVVWSAEPAADVAAHLFRVEAQPDDAGKTDGRSAGVPRQPGSKRRQRPLRWGSATSLDRSLSMGASPHLSRTSRQTRTSIAFMEAR